MMYDNDRDSRRWKVRPAFLRAGWRSVALLLLLTALLTPAGASAETAPWNELPSLNDTTIARTLTRQSGDGYDYYTYEGESFPTGLIAAHARDLDGDHAQEYLTVTMESGNLVWLTVYERASVTSSWAASDRVQLYSSDFTCCTEAHDVFLKRFGGSAGEKYLIFLENWYHEDCIADGASWNFQAYQYENGKLSQVQNIFIDGTDISGNLNSWHTDSYYLTYCPELAEYADALESYDFDISQVYWDQMICEQDDDLEVLCRLYSWYSASPNAISEFVSAGGHQLPAFYTTAIDCTKTSMRLPEYTYLSTRFAQQEADESEVAEPADAMPEPDSAQDYLIPDSDSRLLTEAELRPYDKATLALIRNEILARHGYPFKKTMYREYFDAREWYHRDENFAYSSLNSIEMTNVELIKKLENE